MIKRFPFFIGKNSEKKTKRHEPIEQEIIASRGSEIRINGQIINDLPTPYPKRKGMERSTGAHDERMRDSKNFILNIDDCEIGRLINNETSFDINIVESEVIRLEKTRSENITKKNKKSPLSISRSPNGNIETNLQAL